MQEIKIPHKLPQNNSEINNYRPLHKSSSSRRYLPYYKFFPSHSAKWKLHLFFQIGEYRVNLPDGRVQIVSYTASAEKGYVANVRYEGKARYPETPKPTKRSEKKKRKVVNPYMKFKEKQRRHGDGHVLPKVVSLSPSPQAQQQLGHSSYYEI